MPPSSLGRSQLSEPLGSNQRKAAFARAASEAVCDGFREGAQKPLPRHQEDNSTGWIAEKAGERDTYYVTNTGNSAVANKFPKEASKRASRGGKKPRKAEAEK